MPRENHSGPAADANRKRTRSGRPRYRALLISLALSTAIFVAGLCLVENPTAVRVLDRLVLPLSRLMALIAVGLSVGQIIETLGWTHALSVVARPLFRFSRLGERCGAAFTTAFVSGVAANAMLLNFYKDGNITKKQLFLTNFVNQMPAYFLHLPTTFFIILPLTGIAGLLYYLLTFLAVLLRTFLFLLYGRLFIRPERESADMSVNRGWDFPLNPAAGIEARGVDWRYFPENARPVHQCGRFCAAHLHRRFFY